ncbi:Methionyl-tRNA formyltransferase [Symmachiella macrocystis]|uniref:Methionyl-tRNA formyltransferase n=1 Tax=Symmachiella macrocystis TaxID=2527985 RepID=A0A5C6BNL5_9PLAN|nr:methionyl-tRNA formyltransferase [Symmachiella macrocystis]TWU13615.1 Methionyl-tRNA formyltransferase [Symmachiella macrocystis]
MTRLRLAMMGTGAFAVPTFAGLYDTPHDVVALYTQPARTGRGHHKHVRNPMVELAEAHGTPVLRPAKVNTPESLEEMADLQLDLLVVAAYGQILSAKLLGTPRLGAVNVHASLLPKYRGAAPVNYAILSGETETGVTIFQIEPSLDSGPILGMESLTIGTEETAGELEPRLAQLSVPLAQRVISELAAGTTNPIVQDDAAATLAPKMKKEQGAIDWTRSADEVDWHIRALQPWPKPFTFWHRTNGKPLRLVVPHVHKIDARSAELPGTVLENDEGGLWIQTGTDVVEIVEIQPEGKRAMPAGDFLRGHSVPAGDCFGPLE